MQNFPIILFGSTGFVGRRLKEHFQNKSWPCVELSSRIVDLRSNAAASEWIKSIPPEANFILVYRSHEPPNSSACYDEEVAMAETLAGIIQKVKPRQCIFLSSLSAYGDSQSDLNIQESTPLRPSTYYAKAKIESERILEKSCADARAAFVSLRPCKIYGAGDNPESYGPTSFLHQVIAQKKVTLYGDGNELRDHLWINDLTRLVGELVENKIAGIFNAASGEVLSFKDILKVIGEVTGKPVEIEERARTRPKIDQKVCVDKLKKALPKFQFTSIKQAISLTYENMKVKQP